MKFLKKVENFLFDVLGTLDLAGIVLMCCADDILDMKAYLTWWAVLILGFIGLTLWHHVSPN